MCNSLQQRSGFVLFLCEELCFRGSHIVFVYCNITIFFERCCTRFFERCFARMLREANFRRTFRRTFQRTLYYTLKIYPIKKGFRRSLSLYPEWESNPHARRHTILSRARLPIPPSRHFLSLEECKYKHVFYFPTTALKISKIFPQSIRPKRSTIPTICAFSRIF